MSFSLYVRVDHPDGYTSEFDIVDGQTYNLTPMWRTSGIVPQSEGMRWLDGKPCHTMIAAALRAVLDVQKHEQKYIALNPENGWGDFYGWRLRGLVPFAEAVVMHPTGVIRWEG